ncbi:MAG: flavodoxin-dependent (E)-4-hydroxy-3-methylbut-2-enyl-diphosphate synthase [Actinobacteria bacterium]|nr:flavodoxin-dependent (E)-4-hydroxy-3-methylbut-2-enyl-diphosphate synthase [Actinomycetota bacterium]MBU4240534.1 flavodoxin-dependent (E)-4-hydroxy-3-methylbut-2-enyl-diphosphate synthase [Actinomycetota bacterium]MBU4301371.1 flavodoxin-dependent (E)-4-hydroxy-3-methylbut-2-enyl-diphosphate synthase [Actinomycetota bacterium]MBU4490241.1 flavodoxin-dependent (E)-4-hydroxy-3-methylbut-2-enyl-diphosphate synthase [Actinomycetota bacterium]MCG2795961.1 flavodoxin-dependent (E)-4-hydroxy-3-met
MTGRFETRRIMLGEVPVGGGSPVSVQSMTNTDTADVGATLLQIGELEAAGCDIVRVAVPDRDAGEALGRIVAGTTLPVVADIHFDYRLALLAVEQGVAGIRINPGTMRGGSRLEEIARAAEAAGVVVRVGVNSGSLEKRLRGPGGKVEAAALAESALHGAALMEGCGVTRLKISVKASDVPRTIEAYRIVARESAWPLHVGITGAGTLWSGAIRSAVGIGAILAQGIGDTIRVSLTAQPVEEVRVGRKILASLDLGEAGPQVISCPTCARTEIDVIGLAVRVEKAIESYRAPLTVAVMGCPVNGPGEAREADVGIAGGRDGAVLFVAGEKIRHVPPDSVFDELIGEIRKLMRERGESG